MCRICMIMSGKYPTNLTNLLDLTNPNSIAKKSAELLININYSLVTSPCKGEDELRSVGII